MFTNHYVLSLLSGLIGSVLYFIDAKITGAQRTKFDYIKMLILITLSSLVSLMIYKNGGILSGGSSFHKPLQEIRTGVPTF